MARFAPTSDLYREAQRLGQSVGIPNAGSAMLDNLGKNIPGQILDLVHPDHPIGLGLVRHPQRLNEVVAALTFARNPNVSLENVAKRFGTPQHAGKKRYLVKAPKRLFEVVERSPSTGFQRGKTVDQTGWTVVSEITMPPNNAAAAALGALTTGFNGDPSGGTVGGIEDVNDGASNRTTPRGKSGRPPSPTCKPGPTWPPSPTCAGKPRPNFSLSWVSS